MSMWQLVKVEPESVLCVFYIDQFPWCGAVGSLCVCILIPAQYIHAYCLTIWNNDNKDDLLLFVNSTALYPE